MLAEIPSWIAVESDHLRWYYRAHTGALHGSLSRVNTFGQAGDPGSLGCGARRNDAECPSSRHTSPGWRRSMETPLTPLEFARRARRVYPDREGCAT